MISRTTRHDRRQPAPELVELGFHRARFVELTERELTRALDRATLLGAVMGASTVIAIAVVLGALLLMT